MLITIHFANRFAGKLSMNMKLFQILFFIFVHLMIMLSNGYAQGSSIQGTIISHQQALADVTVQIHSAQQKYQTKSDVNGSFRVEVQPNTYQLTFTKSGYQTQSMTIALSASENRTIKVEMMAVDQKQKEESKAEKSPAKTNADQTAQSPQSIPAPQPVQRKERAKPATAALASRSHSISERKMAPMARGRAQYAISQQSLLMATTPMPDQNQDEFSHYAENDYFEAKSSPLSTFSIDVDTASYALIRSYLSKDQKPNEDAVKIEEMINYFDYQYTAPTEADSHPFRVYTELSMAPWSPKHKLLHIGLQGIKIDQSKLPQSNLVFLIDVSGSMSAPNKLPLLKQAFSLLVENLSEKDKVSIVVYAGAAGLVLPPTPASDKAKIINALSQLNAGGSTAGGAGIELAYQVALDNQVKDGNNRVILATDGDFNVGVNSEGGLLRLIEEKRKSGIFLTVLGFGMGNYKNNLMSVLAEKGNGNQAYIDSVFEAKKVLVEEMGGTLLTIAKDLKIQVEFNPTKVAKYRLIGYESRVLANQDFNNDRKDAGELGAGHSVTALYEIEPVSEATHAQPQVDSLKYQQSAQNIPSEEWANVKLRYKKPNEDQSVLLEHPHQSETEWDKASSDFKFSSAVAMFGMLLKNSKHVGGGSYELVRKIASQSLNEDSYRMDFLEIVKKAMLLK